MSRYVLSLIFLTLGWAYPVAAQDASGISIDALTANIVASNPERRFYADQIDAAGAERGAAGRLPDPELSVEFGQRRAADPLTGAHTGDGAAYAVSILQPIEFGGRIALRRAIAEHQLSLARIGLAQFDATLAARGRSLGYALFAADEKAAAAGDVASRMRALAEVMIQRDAAGPAPRLEAAILQAAAISAERTAALADADANGILYELNQLRGAPFDARIRIIRPDVSLPALPGGDRIMEEASANNFELQSLRVQMEQQGLRVDLAKKARIPTVAIGPYYDHARSDNIETNYGVRLSTTLPLWNGQAAGVAQEQGKQAQADAALLAARRQIARQVFEQAALYGAKRDALDRWPADAPARFAAAARAADGNFRMGAIPVATYVEMQSQYLAALSAVLDTRREALAALLQLRALNGGQTPGGGAQ
ncbi:MAG TPA: TolC family protein [Sphingomonas sp.]